MELSDRIRAARTKLGLTQRQVAAAMGVTHGAVAQWEGAGGGNRVRPEHLLPLARVLQISVADLLGETATEGLQVTEPTELALVELYRRLPATLKDIHMRLMYEQVGSSGAAQEKRRPAQGRKVAN